ncbi:O-antigen ligase family protein [Pseudomonas fluorescens]|nr:O-antigen ligase family protein [Pseudomonas fluorescens]
MRYFKINRLELLLSLILIDQVFLGAVKRIYLSIAGRDQIYFSYISLFPVMVISAFFLIMLKRNFKLPKLGSISTLYYLFLLNAILVCLINIPNSKMLVSLIHTYYTLLLIPVLAYFSRNGTDLIRIFRNVFLITLPVVSLHTLIHAAFGILPFEQAWAADSWSSLYIGNVGEDRRFRPFATFEDPGYLSAYYIFGAFSLYLRPLKSILLNRCILTTTLALSFLPLKSSALIAFIISVAIAKSTSKIKQKSIPRILAFVTISLISISFTQVSTFNLSSIIKTDSVVMNERLSLGTLKARFLKYDEIFSKVKENPFGHGADFVSFANANTTVNFIDSDSQYLTILANFGVQGFLLYMVLILSLVKGISPKFPRDKLLIAIPLFWAIMSFTTEVLSNRFTFICIAFFVAALMNNNVRLRVSIPSNITSIENTKRAKICLSNQ